MGTRPGDIMIISIQSDSHEAIFELYAELSGNVPASAYMVSVDGDTLFIHMSDDSFTDQKVLINEIKQFMRDNSFNYKMEIK